MSPTPPPERPLGLAIMGTFGPAMLVLSLFVLYLVHVPAAKRTFDEYAMTLPWLTLKVVRISNWVAEYWWALVPVFAVLGAGNFALLVSLGRRSRSAARLWIAGIALVLIGFAVVTIVAMELPMMKLRQGLAN